MSNTTIPVPVELLANIVSYFEKSAELFSEADNIEKKEQTVKSAVASKLPDLVDKLIKAGMLPPEQRAQASVKLQDPVAVLNSLSKVAEAWKPAPKAQEKNDTLGSATEIKSASVAGLELKRKESDTIWEKAFGNI